MRLNINDETFNLFCLHIGIDTVCAFLLSTAFSSTIRINVYTEFHVPNRAFVIVVSI